MRRERTPLHRGRPSGGGRRHLRPRPRIRRNAVGRRRSFLARNKEPEPAQRPRQMVEFLPKRGAARCLTPPSYAETMSTTGALMAGCREICRNGNVATGGPVPQSKRLRKPLTLAERKIVRAKTGGRCHVCGGLLGKNWCADHVLAHCRSGDHAVDNYLPACTICHRLRWHYKPGRFRKILALGVYVATEIREKTELGNLVRARFNHRKRPSKLRRK